MQVMNTAQLKERLTREGFKPNTYSIGGPLPPYAGLILEKSGTLWEIDYFERGMRRRMASFVDEEQACERMYELLMEHFRTLH